MNSTVTLTGPTVDNDIDERRLVRGKPQPDLSEL